MTLRVVHLRDPLIHLGVLVQECFLKLLSSKVKVIFRLPVGLAVENDLVDIIVELVVAVVLIAVHLALDCHQVHGLLDLVKVIRDLICNRVDRLPEGANKTSPKACNYSKLDPT